MRSAHSEPIWSLAASGQEFVSADNEGSVILWTVRDPTGEEGETTVEKRIAISGMGSVPYTHTTDKYVVLPCLSE